MEVKKGDLVVALSMSGAPFYKVGKDTKVKLPSGNVELPTGTYLDLSTFEQVTPQGVIETEANADDYLPLNFSKAILDAEGNIYCQLIIANG